MGGMQRASSESWSRVLLTTHLAHEVGEVEGAKAHEGEGDREARSR
jgi:hypothetical protein